MFWNLKTILFFVFLFCNALAAFSQSKLYFDKGGKSSDETSAYYYRQKTGGVDSYKSYYVNGGALYFDGRISTASDADENLNVYGGTCTWYYKNGNKKSNRTFDKDGLETGTSTSYYESGKLWKEIDFAGGKPKSSFKEYDEDGRSSRIFEDDFKDNSNDWDLYNSDKTAAALRFGSLELASFTPAGASRYISHPIESNDFAIEAVINLVKLKEGTKAGIIFGFKDWQNYNFFLITGASFYIGTVYEGISATKADGMFSGDVLKNASNNLKIISNGEKFIYSINGVIQYTTDRLRLSGSNIGFAISGKSTVQIEKLIIKEIDFKNSHHAARSEADFDVKATGSGLIISKSGYVLTNYHVIQNSNKIVLQINNGGTISNYEAIVVQKDIDNDLAILQIQDASFKPLESLKYAFRESGGVDVGASVFTIGYPYALSGMGIEAKFTDGKVSSKTGYNNAINTYQTSIPVQPGNSGGPLFDEKGQFLGVINSKVTGADNVSYAIKLNYVKNLIDLLPETIELPKDQTIGSISLEEKIKVLSNYVALIKIK
jgi:S1-C subfamily serine protease